MAHIHEFASLAGYAAVSTTTSASGAAIDLQPYLNDNHVQISATLNCIGVTGATGTLDVKLQESVDTTSGDFTDIVGATFTQLSTSTASLNTLQTIYFNTNKRYVRFATTAGGSTPSFSVVGQIQAIQRLV